MHFKDGLCLNPGPERVEEISMDRTHAGLGFLVLVLTTISSIVSPPA